MFFPGTRSKVSAALVLILVTLTIAGCQDPPLARRVGDNPPPPDPVEKSSNDPWTEIHNVHLRSEIGAVQQVRILRGRLERTRADEPVFFDHADSFTIRITEAEVAIDAASLAAILNGYVFSYEGAPIREVEIEIHPDRIVQHGHLAKALGVPFTVEATLAVTDDGGLRLTPQKIHAAGLPVTKAFDLFSVEMADVINAEKARGLTIEGDTLLLDPQRMMPPPQIRGRVSEARLEEGLLVLKLIPPVATDGEEMPTLAPSNPDAGNFMFFSGGELRFGKLTMHQADLQIVDADVSDPFDFNLPELNRQLVAGYSLTMPDDGLIAVIPDFDAIGTQAIARPELPEG